MSNNTPNWMNKWQRSPRQDRRVLIDGKFVEQGPVQYPEPPQEEQQESALEVVQIPTEVIEARAQEAIDAKQAPLSPAEVHDLALEIVVDEQVKNAAKELGWEKPEEKTDVDEAFEFLEIPPVPTEAWQFIESAQNAGNLISGSVKAPAVLPTIGEDTVGEGVLDGAVGRVEQVEKTQEPL